MESLILNISCFHVVKCLICIIQLLLFLGKYPFFFFFFNFMSLGFTRSQLGQKPAAAFERKKEKVKANIC